MVPESDLLAMTQRYADEMLLSPMGLRLTKEGLNVAIDAPGLEAAIAVENRNQVLSRTEDARRVCVPLSKSAHPLWGR